VVVYGTWPLPRRGTCFGVSVHDREIVLLPASEPAVGLVPGVTFARGVGQRPAMDTEHDLTIGLLACRHNAVDSVGERGGGWRWGTVALGDPTGKAP